MLSCHLFGQIHAKTISTTCLGWVGLAELRVFYHLINQQPNIKHTQIKVKARPNEEWAGLEPSHARLTP